MFDITLKTFNFTLLVGVFFFLCGILFKISAFPFHIWTPDVYSGVFLIVTMFFSLSLKVAYFAFLIKFLVLIFFLSKIFMITYIYLFFVWFGFIRIFYCGLLYFFFWLNFTLFYKFFKCF